MNRTKARIAELAAYAQQLGLRVTGDQLIADTIAAAGNMAIARSLLEARAKELAQAREALARGSVVDYHGSITQEHGRFIVTYVDERTGLLMLMHEAQRDFTLRRVRPVSVTPTGASVDYCVICLHDVSEHRDGWCFRYGDGSDGTRPCGCPGLVTHAEVYA